MYCNTNNSKGDRRKFIIISWPILAFFSGKTRQPANPVAHLLELGRETRGGAESHPFFLWVIIGSEKEAIWVNHK